MKKATNKESPKAGSATAPPLARGPGRPSAADGRNVSRASILRTALRLAKETPLQDLSILMVARSMKIAPGLVHYYLGGRDWLTSGVINLFYKELVKNWPKETGVWEEDLRAAAKLVYGHFANYGGVAAYVVSNSRFRIYQLTAFSDKDWGVEFLERFAASVHAAGLPAERSALYAHLLLEFIINTGHATARHIHPAEHRKFLEEKTAQLDPEKFPNIFQARFSPLTIDGIVAFDELCRLFLLGIKTDLAAAQDLNGGAGLAKPAQKDLRQRRAPAHN
jgi:AcrR family transcriptional regulator